MKICIIGAGISGLSLAQMLTDRHDVTIYEKSDVVGGIARTKTIDNITFHQVGGHCFNSNNNKVLDFVFDKILPKNKWNKVHRVAKIFFKENLISYPIEYAIKEIEKFDSKLAFNMTKDFLSCSERKSTKNLSEWFVANFGETLAREYFIPYNQKIWQTKLDKVSADWIEGKLPVPNKYDFFTSLLHPKIDSMPHATFYYPKSNNQNTFIDAMASYLEIQFNKNVFSIEKKTEGWIVNELEYFDLVISTIPLNLLPFIIRKTPEFIKEQAKKLKYNKVTNVLWKTEENEHTWTYFPSEKSIFHRHIHIGNFFSPKKNYTITESIGDVSFEKMVKYGLQEKYLLEPVAYNVSDHAYVLFDSNYKEVTTNIKSYLNDIGLYTLGRFGEWEYYNMDICIEKAMIMAEKINTLSD